MDDNTLSALAPRNAVQRDVASFGRWTQSGPGFSQHLATPSKYDNPTDPSLDLWGKISSYMPDHDAMFLQIGVDEKCEDQRSVPADYQVSYDGIKLRVKRSPISKGSLREKVSGIPLLQFG
jgi:hypothetical protein